MPLEYLAFAFASLDLPADRCGAALFATAHAAALPNGTMRAAATASAAAAFAAASDPCCFFGDTPACLCCFFWDTPACLSGGR